jgi:hypothetical protein
MKIENYDYEVLLPESHIGWFKIKLPPTAIARLNEYIDDPETKAQEVSHALAGNISNSYYLTDVDNWFFKNYLEFMCFDYLDNFNYQPASVLGMMNYEKHPFQLDSLWVNFQRQNEFNPSHTHSGVFSFAIFMKIPTHWQEQHNLPSVTKSNCPRASDFVFEYLTPLGDMAFSAFKMSPDLEGWMLFFPAMLNHMVYPFYKCDEPRISIAGNITYNTDVLRRKKYEI